MVIIIYIIIILIIILIIIFLKRTATYNVSFPHSESVSLSTQKVLNVHFPTFLLSALMTSTALAGHEHGAEGPSARSGRGARPSPPAGVLPCPKRIIFDKKTGLLHGKARITLNELSEDGVLVKYGCAARHEQLLACTGHSDVEFAVDGFSVLLEAVGTKEVELIRMADSE